MAYSLITMFEYFLLETKIGFLFAVRKSAPNTKIEYVGISETIDEAISFINSKFQEPSICKTDDIKCILEQIKSSILTNDAMPDVSNFEIKGTNFQKLVWNAISQIPKGQKLTYQDIAIKIGKPKATRAVGNACAKNNLCLIIPCHRVISKNDSNFKYAWGGAIKNCLLELEKKLFVN